MVFVLIIFYALTSRLFGGKKGGQTRLDRGVTPNGVYRFRNPACLVTGMTFAPLLRASHIKPWAACENGNERLDPYNGIILAAHIDILFDQGGDSV